MPYFRHYTRVSCQYSDVCPSRRARLRRKFCTEFSAKRVCLVVVGAFDIVSVETCQSSFCAGRIRRYARGHVAGNRVDAGGGTGAASGAQGVHACAYVRALCARARV